jgi:hypothetical protein
VGDKDYRVDRHQELLKEGSRHIGAWILAVLSFAVFLPNRVLEPYRDGMRAQAAIAAQEKAEAEEQKTVDAVAAGMQSASTVLASVSAEMAKRPWDQKVVALRERLVKLGDATERCMRWPDDRLAEMANPESAAWREMEGALRTDLGLRPRRGASFASQTAPIAEPPPDAIARSLEGMTDRLQADLAAKQPAQIRETLSAAMRAMAQAIADGTVEAIEAQVQQSIVEPLGAAVAELDAAAPASSAPSAAGAAAAGVRAGVASVREHADRLAAEVGEWKRRFARDENWWRSFTEKREAVETLNSAIDQSLRGLTGAVRKLDEDVAKRKSALAAERKDFDARRADLKASFDELEKRMQELMPAGVRSLISVVEMVQVFPYFVLGAAIYLLVRITSLRTSFDVVRGGLDPQDPRASDPALTPVWIPAWRRRGTWLTLGLLGFVIAVLWWSFAAGASLHGELAPQVSPRVGWACDGLGVARVLGHLFFAAAAAALVLTVLRDRRVASRAR